MMTENNAARWPAAHPPIAPREDHEIRQLGRRRLDPYAWMKFIPRCGTRTLDNLPPRLRDHLRAEMKYAQDILGSLAPEAERFRDHMAARVVEVSEPLPVSPKGWRYEATRPEGGSHRIFSRLGPDGDAQFLFDEAERAQGHAYYRATDHQFSPDERYFAWAEDIIGDDRHRICILDMDRGVIRTLVREDAFGYGGLTFSPSSRYLFWIWRDAYSRPTRLYRTPVDGGETALVYEEHDPALFMRIGRTAADGFVALTLAGPDIGEVHLIAADAETAPPRLVRPRRRGIRYEVDEWDGALLMLTDEGGADDRKILGLDPDRFAVQREWVPHRAGVPIVAMRPFEGTLVRLERVEGLPRLVLLHADGRETPVCFDESAYSIDITPSQPYRAQHIRIVHQAPASPPRWLDIRLDDGQCDVVAQVRLRHFDPAAYRVERLHAVADDGETVPVTVLSRRDMAPGTASPVLLTGYGAYGVASEARFSLPAIALVDAGFRYAIAHVRGGSEKGARWYKDGCRASKRNSMTDFIASARHLLATGHAAPGQIVAQGVSAGGLLVCGAMNRAPSLWAGVIAQVPFVDMLNTLSDANHPLVPLLSPDWGDPLTDPQAYDYIIDVSPYENVGPAAYPPVLCTAGLKDDRVPYWEPAKLLAAIRHERTNDRPAVLALNPDSGHQGTDDRNSEFSQASLFWAFAQRCVGRGPPFQ